MIIDLRKYLRTLLLPVLFLGRQCKAGREWFTVYQPQSDDTNVQTGRTVNYKKDRASSINKKILALLLKPANSTPSDTGSSRSFHRDIES